MPGDGATFPRCSPHPSSMNCHERRRGDALVGGGGGIWRRCHGGRPYRQGARGPARDADGFRPRPDHRRLGGFDLFGNGHDPGHGGGAAVGPAGAPRRRRYRRRPDGAGLGWRGVIGQRRDDPRDPPRRRGGLHLRRGLGPLHHRPSGGTCRSAPRRRHVELLHADRHGGDVAAVTVPAGMGRLARLLAVHGRHYGALGGLHGRGLPGRRRRGRSGG